MAAGRNVAEDLPQAIGRRRGSDHSRAHDVHHVDHGDRGVRFGEDCGDVRERPGAEPLTAGVRRHEQTEKSCVAHGANGLGRKLRGLVPLRGGGLEHARRDVASGGNCISECEHGERV